MPILSFILLVYYGCMPNNQILRRFMLTFSFSLKHVNRKTMFILFIIAVDLNVMEILHFLSFKIILKTLRGKGILSLFNMAISNQGKEIKYDYSSENWVRLFVTFIFRCENISL